ncbi:hypothetical protein OE88DRAFT_1736749 [Heliocybe sulcata]|uniref:Uncharacterized protein n=1 Tax=Heliocybe sulcata TaxID=5364 RepID=A0A5C3MWU1_9AGAM|nr:hypothetical protein OE88DRAFT_1736749 [Heliocybe sulcata]
MDTSTRDVLGADLRAQSFIHRLPVELLSAIFILCLDSTFIRPDRRKVPLLPSQVCSRWRTCALDTPRLWSSLSIADTAEEHKHTAFNIGYSRLPRQSNGRFGSQLIILKIWATRSRGLPLSLSVHLASKYSEQDQAHSQVLSSYFIRAQVLHLHLDSTWLPMLSGITCGVLEELSVESRTSDSFSLDHPLHAPHLLRLHLHYATEWALGSFVFSHSRLTELIWHPTWESERLIEMLASCGSLTHCSVAYREYPESQPSTVSLPSLEQLEVFGDHTNDIRPLLRSLDVPRLEKLKFNMRLPYESEARLDAHSIRFMLYRSSCQLRHLEVQFKSPLCTDATDFLALLEAVPCIEVLRLEGRYGKLYEAPSDLKQIFQALKYAPPRKRLVPYLSEIYISFPCKYNEFPSNLDVETMLSSRVAGEDNADEESTYLWSATISLSALQPSPIASITWHGLNDGLIYRDTLVRGREVYTDKVVVIL